MPINLDPPRRRGFLIPRGNSAGISLNNAEPGGTDGPGSATAQAMPVLAALLALAASAPLTACHSEACHDEDCGSGGSSVGGAGSGGQAGSGGSHAGGSHSGGTSGASSLAAQYCECMLSDCHDDYHRVWGEDHIDSEQACLAEANALPVNGSATESGPSIECRIHFCQQGHDTPALCTAALGNAPCE